MLACFYPPGFEKHAVSRRVRPLHIREAARLHPQLEHRLGCDVATTRRVVSRVEDRPGRVSRERLLRRRLPRQSNRVIAIEVVLIALPAQVWVVEQRVGDLIEVASGRILLTAPPPMGRKKPQTVLLDRP